MDIYGYDISYLLPAHFATLFTSVAKYYKAGRKLSPSYTPYLVTSVGEHGADRADSGVITFLGM